MLWKYAHQYVGLGIFHIFDMTDSCVWHDTSTPAIWFIHVCYMTHSWAWLQGSLCMGASWSRGICFKKNLEIFLKKKISEKNLCTHLRRILISIWRCVWHDPFICVTWPIHVCDMTHSCVWHEWSICVTFSYVWHDAFICVIWIVYVCDMTLSYVWHDSGLYVT